MKRLTRLRPDWRTNVSRNTRSRAQRPAAPSGGLARLGDAAARRAKAILVLAALFVVLSIGVGHDVFSALKAPGFDDPESPSQRAAATLQRAAGFDVDPGFVVLARSSASIRSEPRARAEIRRLADRMARDPQVARVLTYRENPALLSRNARATLLVANLRSPDRDAGAPAVERLREALTSSSLALTFGGPAVAFRDIQDGAESDLRTAELLAFPLLAILLIVIFRGAVAALLSLLVGAMTVVGTFFLLRVLSEAMDISVFALNLVTALGLGLAVDYSLFLISRYRSELHAGRPSREALAIAMSTSGKTVLFSALTVAGALAALCLFPQRFLSSMGLGGVLVSLMTAVVALTVVPAALTVLGPRIDALPVGRGEPGSGPTWRRISGLVARRPIGVATLTTGALLALTLPALGLNFTGLDARILPSDAPARQVVDALAREFTPNLDAPVNVVAKAAATPAGERDVARIVDRLGADRDVSAVLPPQRVGGDRVLIQALPRPEPQSQAAGALVERVRALPLPAGTLVGGGSAAIVDFRDSVASHLPLALVLVAASTFVLLFLMTGSVVLPAVALVMNALALGAAYGVSRLVFQDGALESLLGYSSQAALDTASAMLLFAMSFGLATDYGVFLLSRAKEELDRGRSPGDAVRAATNGVNGLVASAALLFCVAIGALATSSILLLKQTGLGTAVAVAVYATLVSVALLPALMQLLGARAWWAPAPLRRLHDRFGIREGGARAPIAVPPTRPRTRAESRDGRWLRRPHAGAYRRVLEGRVRSGGAGGVPGDARLVHRQHRGSGDPGCLSRQHRRRCLLGAERLRDRVRGVAGPGRQARRRDRPPQGVHARLVRVWPWLGTVRGRPLAGIPRRRPSGSGCRRRRGDPDLARAPAAVAAAPAQGRRDRRVGGDRRRRRRVRATTWRLAHHRAELALDLHRQRPARPHRAARLPQDPARDPRPRQAATA